MPREQSTQPTHVGNERIFGKLSCAWQNITHMRGYRKTNSMMFPLTRYTQPTYVGIETTCFMCTNERQSLQPTIVGIEPRPSKPKSANRHTAHIRGDRKANSRTPSPNSTHPTFVGIATYITYRYTQKDLHCPHAWVLKPRRRTEARQLVNTAHIRGDRKISSQLVCGITEHYPHSWGLQDRYANRCVFQ